jgi:quaternary ammonium compound-resistance protein SugE
MSSPWIALIAAGLLEVCWAAGLKYTRGFTRPGPSLFTAATLAASMYLLAKASRALPIGTAYPVWVGIGAAGAAILGMLLSAEPVTPLRIGFLALLIFAIAGLKYTAG